MTIYLIGPPGGGAARAQSEAMASIFEQDSGYHRCTQEQYLQRVQEIRASLGMPPDPTEPPTEFNRTASDTPNEPK